MFTRPYKIFVGKDDTRTGGVADGANMNTLVQNIEDLEVVVLDKNMEVMAAGATIADTDSIYICAGTGDTFDYTPESGSAVTGARKVILSDVIEGALVKSYVGTAYTAKAEQTTQFACTGLTVTEGTEYVLRITYTDLEEHPGQFVHSYRYIAASGDTATTVGTALVAKVNAHAGRRVNATGTVTPILTGRAIPDCTSGLTDIDEFKMVEFDAFLNYVDANDNWVEWGATKTTVAAVYGSGTWELVRDLEKIGQANKGVTNKIYFPVQSPGFATTKDETYDIIVIEHEKSYRSPDNQYGKQFILTTVIAIPFTATANQMTTILSRLNPWLASCPGAFPNITF